MQLQVNTIKNTGAKEVQVISDLHSGNIRKARIPYGSKGKTITGRSFIQYLAINLGIAKNQKDTEQKMREILMTLKKLCDVEISE